MSEGFNTSDFPGVETRFNALAKYAKGSVIVGWILVGLGGIALFLGLSMMLARELQTWFVGAGMAAGGAGALFFGFGLVLFGQCLLCFHAIEHNTRAAAIFLQAGRPASFVPFPTQSKGAPSACAFCGAALEPHDTFCSRCGKTLSRSVGLPG